MSVAVASLKKFICKKTPTTMIFLIRPLIMIEVSFLKNYLFKGYDKKSSMWNKTPGFIPKKELKYHKMLNCMCFL